MKEALTQSRVAAQLNHAAHAVEQSSLPVSSDIEG